MISSLSIVNRNFGGLLNRFFTDSFVTVETLDFSKGIMCIAPCQL